MNHVVVDKGKIDQQLEKQKKNCSVKVSQDEIFDFYQQAKQEEILSVAS